MTQNNPSPEQSSVIEKTVQFVESLVPMADWAEADNKAVLTLAMDIDGEPTKSVSSAFGNDYILELMIYAFLKKYDNKQMRHRLTRALAKLMTDELDAEDRIAQSTTEQTAN